VDGVRLARISWPPRAERERERERETATVTTRVWARVALRTAALGRAGYGIDGHGPDKHESCCFRLLQSISRSQHNSGTFCLLHLTLSHNNT
jgi:hypothetical protein